MDLTPVAHDEEDIDLRKIILTVLRRWKLLLIVTVLVGAAAILLSFLMPPAYQASSQVLIDPIGIPPSIDPTVLLLNMTVRQDTADTLGKTVSSLPKASVTVDSSDLTRFTITAQGTSAQAAVQAANAFSAAVLEWIRATVQPKLDQEAETHAAVNAADQALVSYLDKNNLGQLTWADLGMLTGVGGSWGLLPTETQPLTASSLPVLTSDQRLEIARLMQARVDAQTVYTDANSKAIPIHYAIAVDQPAINQSFALARASRLKALVKNTALGVVAGLMLAVFWIFLQDWWRSSAEAEKKSN